MPRRSALREDTFPHPSLRFRRRPITTLRNSAPVDDGRCSVACAAAGSSRPCSLSCSSSSSTVRDGDVAPVEPSALEVLLWSAAAATVAVYALYTVAARDQSELSVIVPFVAFGVACYLYLVHRDDLGEEPEKVLLEDTPTLLSVALWALIATWIVTLS